MKVLTHLCVTYWDSVRVIRKISQLFRIDILLIHVYSSSFVNAFVTHPPLFLTHSGSFLSNLGVFMFVRTDSYWFVLCLYHVRGALSLIHVLNTNISRTLQMGSSRYKNTVRTCRMKNEFETNSHRYTNKYKCYKQQYTFVPSLRRTKNTTMHESVPMTWNE